jgi:hypothetical protein
MGTDRRRGAKSAGVQPAFEPAEDTAVDAKYQIYKEILKAENPLAG